jgi:hypothetical protein
MQARQSIGGVTTSAGVGSLHGAAVLGGSGWESRGHRGQQAFNCERRGALEPLHHAATMNVGRSQGASTLHGNHPRHTHQRQKALLGIGVQRCQ